MAEFLVKRINRFIYLDRYIVYSTDWWPQKITRVIWLRKKEDKMKKKNNCDAWDGTIIFYFPFYITYYWSVLDTEYYLNWYIRSS